MWTIKNVEYPKIDILFFERPVADLKKFAFKIAYEIKLKRENITLGAVCIEIPDGDDSIEYFFHWNDVKKNIDLFLKRCNVKLIVFSNWRIPDIEFIQHAKVLNIKTILIQEGLIYDGISINSVNIENIIKSFVLFFNKSISYIDTMRRMCQYEKKSSIKLFSLIISKKKNITCILSDYFNNRLIADYVLIVGEYWREYYHNQIGYPLNRIILVGDHDLDDFKTLNKGEEAICYIASVLVEDGTIDRTEFLKFIRILSKCVNSNTKLYIKLHPRSDITLYGELRHNNVEFIDIPGYLPSVNLYIAHRGSLIGKALYESDNLVIWKFSSESHCFYERFATSVCEDFDELQKSIKSIDLKKRTNKKRMDISNVYWQNPNGAIRTITNIACSYMVKGKIDFKEEKDEGISYKS